MSIIKSALGNLEFIINDVEHLISKDFKSSQGKIYNFHGILWGHDDFYYEMYDWENKTFEFFSCCISLEQYGFTLIEAA